MKLLFVCWFFPPSNTIAAVRLGKLAKNLAARGHDIRVLTAKDAPYQQSLAVEFPPERTFRTGWRSINALPIKVMSLIRKMGLRRKAVAPDEAASDGSAKAPAGAQQPRVTAGRLTLLYQRLFNFPDERIGWLPAARRRGLAIMKDWRPDAIFASAPPYTTLLIGYVLSKATGVPLIVELRDRWSDDPYYPPPAWRLRFDRWIEHKILRHASAITTVSEPWAKTYRGNFAKPTEVIYNAFDPADLQGEASEGWPDSGVLQIMYTGIIYPGRRDPTPLFQAIGSDEDLKSNVRVDFYGTNANLVHPLTQACGIEDIVKVHGRVDHAEALRLQRCSDVLLLMQWDDPKEQGNVPGKFFEYLGARRPILVLGLADGVPATIVKERNAGVTSTDPAEIAKALKAWLAEKKAKGLLPNLPLDARKGFTHEEQAEKLEAFLTKSL